jgi:hypothetical protein
MEELKTILISTVLLLVVARDSATGQNQAEANRSPTSVVSCSVRTDSKEWIAKRPATVYVTVESLSGSAFEKPLWSALHLEPTHPEPSLGPATVSDRIIAGLDPAVLDPFDRSGVVTKHGDKGDSVLLRFTRKGDRAKFKFDAGDLVWDYEVVNRSPMFRLFAIAKPGKYWLQFQMSSGPCSSAKVTLTIAADKSTT